MEDYGPPDRPQTRTKGPEGFPGPSKPSHRPAGPSYGAPPLVAPRPAQHMDEDGDDRSAFVRWCDSELGEDTINLEHTWPEEFVTSQWPVPARWYILYRSVAALVLVCWVAGDIVYETRNFYHGRAWRWFIFASNWSFLALAVTSLILAATCFLYERKPYWIMDPIHIRSMPSILKFQWLLYNVSSCSALVVTTGYWGYIAFVSDSHFLYIPTPEGPQRVLLTSHMSRLKHTANTVYVLADLFISATPIRLQHMFLTIFMASLYIVFNGLYYVSFGALLVDSDGQASASQRGYYFMNWADPVEAICTCVLGMMLVVLAQFLLHLLFLLRRWLHARCVNPPSMVGGDSELQNIISRSSTYNSLNGH